MTAATAAPLSLSDPARSFHVRWRALLEDPSGLQPIDVAIVASFTVEPIVPYLGCLLAGRGLFPRLQLAPFGQVYQALLSPAGTLFAARPALTVVLCRAEDLLAPQLLRLDSLAGPAAIEEARGACLAEIGRLCQATRAHARESGGLVLLSTLPPPQTTPLGPLDAGHPASRRQLLRRLNLSIGEALVGEARVRPFDLCAVVEEVGTARAYDQRRWYLSRCPFSDVLLRHAAQALCRTIAAQFAAPRKVIVLDLDGTLWGGVVGEDGPAGITLSGEGLGEAYLDFQEALLCLRAQGVLLCVASKNNEADAFEVLDHHQEVRLRRHHLSATRICWQDKVASLRALAQELSLSLDSFVFIDDSPAECEQVRRRLPEVAVLQLPPDPAEYVTALRHLPDLDRPALTDEDLGRAARYAAEQARQAARPVAKDPGDEGAASEIEAFLRSLDLRLTVRRLVAADVPRAAQLTRRTHQFNLTTLRRTEAEIAALGDDPACRIYLAAVSDRFGDYGTTGLAIVRRRGNEAGTWELDTLLLSCRVLCRGVETGLLDAVIDDLCDDPTAGPTALYATFCPTGKNEPARDFLPTHGFLEDAGGFVLPLPRHRGQTP